MGYKLIASDLDGTLLNNDGKISKENFDAIKKLYEMGVYFAPTSGRSFAEMPKEIKDNKYIRFYIGSGGTTIYDKNLDKTHSLCLPKEVSHFALDTFFKYSVNMMLHADNCSYVDLDMHNVDTYKTFNCNEYWIDFIFNTNKPVSNFKNFAYTKDIEMFCTFFKSQNELLKCKEIFSSNPELLVVQSDEHNIELVWKNAGKGNAVLKLAEILGIDKKEIIAVGDSTNDLTMIKVAGLGLAMENAVDELKQVADKVICSNKEHSAKYILENFIK